MTRQNRRYTPEFKANIIAAVKNGQSVAMVARENGISPKTIYNWTAPSRRSKRTVPRPRVGDSTSSDLQREVHRIVRGWFQDAIKREASKLRK